MTSIEQLLDSLDDSRLLLLEAIEDLPDEALLENEAIGSWSIADTLANITVWEAELVTGMMNLDQGKPPKRMLATLKNPRVFDQERYEENKGRDLDRIFADLQQVRLQVEEWLPEFTEKELNDPKRYPSLQGRSLSKVIAMMTFEREGLYIPQIESFAALWLAKELDSQASVISLSAVDVNSFDENDEKQD